MAGFDGSGNYTLNYTFATEAASPPIAISKLDTELAGIATALSSVMLRNGTGVPSADTPWNNKKITGLADAAAATDAMNRQASDARYATLTAPVFSTSIEISAANPFQNFRETDADANEKIWRLVSAGGNFYLQALTDVAGIGSNPITVERTGTTIDSITFAATTVAITGNGTVSGTLAVTGAATVAAASSGGHAMNRDTADARYALIAAQATSGSFTASLREANESGTVLATGTAYWKKVNNVVTLRLPDFTGTSSSTWIGITGLPAAIQVGSLAGTTVQVVPMLVLNNAVNTFGWVTIGEGSGTIGTGCSGGWTNSSGTKGTSGSPIITYQITD